MLFLFVLLLFQNVCIIIIIRPSFLFISRRWKRKAARHCARSEEGSSGNLWPPSVKLPLVSNHAVPVWEQSKNKILFHAPCPRANEGNSIRVILEDRLDAANALKKQMWAEAQLDKRRMKEEFVAKFNDTAYAAAAAEGSQSPMAIDHRNSEVSLGIMVKDECAVQMDNAENLHAEKSSFSIDTTFSQMPNMTQQNGYTTERSRLQLKAYIGHRAEEMYVYRSLPLGLDRRRNRYWLFVASPSSQDPGSGRIFVESPDGYWRLIDSEKVFDALLTSLDTRGVRESHLYIMLKKIEGPFRELAQKDLSGTDVIQNEKKTTDEVDELSSRPGLLYHRYIG